MTYGMILLLNKLDIIDGNNYNNIIFEAVSSAPIQQYLTAQQLKIWTKSLKIIPKK
jgi:hypothetical protein